MAAMDMNEPEVPEVGDDILVEVVPSQTRTSYFPDQGAVFGRGPDLMEIVFLRQEIRLASQVGKVRSRDADAMRVDFQPHQVHAEMVDVAHVRMDTNAATEMALAIIMMAMKNDHVSGDDIMNRLQMSRVQAT